MRSRLLKHWFVLLFFPYQYPQIDYPPLGFLGKQEEVPATQTQTRALLVDHVSGVHRPRPLVGVRHVCNLSLEFHDLVKGAHVLFRSRDVSLYFSGPVGS